MIVSNRAIERIAQILSGPQGKARAEASPSVSKQRSDEVTISAEGREILALQRRLAQTPEVRADKVEALRAQIVRGEYKVSADKIAERMLKAGDIHE